MLIIFILCKYDKILFLDTDILPINVKFYSIFNFDTPAIMIKGNNNKAMLHNKAPIKKNGFLLEDTTGNIESIVLNVKKAIDNVILNIDKYVSFVQVEDPQEMMELAVKELGMDQTNIGCTTTCHEDENAIFQLIHIHDENNSKEECSDINFIASSIAQERTRVVGTAVLTCSLLSDNNKTFIPTNVTKAHLIDLIMLRVYHKGIFIDSNSQIQEMTYIYDPIECFEKIVAQNKEEVPNHKGELAMVNVTLAGFEFICVCDNNIEAKMNQLASFMFERMVKGACFIYIRHKGCDFVNLDSNFFEKIRLLLSKDKRNELIKIESYPYMILNYRELNHMMIAESKI